MFNEPAISMRELELESAELLPSRETLCVTRWHLGCGEHRGFGFGRGERGFGFGRGEGGQVSSFGFGGGCEGGQVGTFGFGGGEGGGFGFGGGCEGRRGRHLRLRRRRRLRLLIAV